MNQIVPTNLKIPAHLANRVGSASALAQSLTGGLASSASYPRISIKGARFRIVEGESETVLPTTSLDVVIVGANPRLSKTYYAKQWTPDAEPAAPDCFSLDGIGPDPDATSPQNDLCASCPQNAWGSKVTPQGQQVKACADQKRLAVVAAEDPTGPRYLLQVTPAALKNLNQYQKELAMRGIPPEIVMTRVSFDTNASFPKLTFSFGGFLSEETQAVVDGLFGSDEVKEITGETPRVATAPEQAPKPALVAPKVAKAPEPVAVEDEVEETEPSTPPARGFGAAAKPAAKAAPKATAKPTAKPAAPPEAASSLADEIAALVGEVDDDDA